MVYEWREPRNYVEGTLLEPAAISDTTIKSNAFTGLPTTYSTSRYLPLVLHNPTAGLYELVWVTGHASSSTSVTVVRGREGSTAQAWTAETRVLCAPSSRDVVGVSTLAGLPADAHLGARYAVSDKSYVAEKTNSGGWGPTVGVALGDHVGPRGSGANAPGDAALVVRAGYATGAVDGSGQLAVTFRQPFLTACVAVVLAGARGSDTFYSVTAESTTGFTATAWKITDLAPYTTTAITGFTATVQYIAVGY